MLSSILDDIHTSLEGNLSVIKINVDELTEFSSEFDILSIPVLILFQDGNVIGRKNGFMSGSAIKTWLSESSIWKE
jgi:thioredoxin 1